MNHKERAEMVLRRIGTMKFFDLNAIEKVLADEFLKVEKETIEKIASKNVNNGENAVAKT